MGTCCTACNEEGSIRNKPLTVKKVVDVKKKKPMVQSKFSSSDNPVEKKPVAQAKVAKVMSEFASGNLKSSSGEKVPANRRDIAQAIAFSEARRAAKKSKA